MRKPIAATAITLCTATFAFAPLGVTAKPNSRADPFAILSIYDGDWAVQAEHPWSGASKGATDHLMSCCHHFTSYFACEQTVNGKPLSLIVYTATDDPKKLNTRMIAPNGLAGGRGELSISDGHWTYLDKPPAALKGPWSRVENKIIDRDHIQFEEYESADEGKSWNKVNSGLEVRVKAKRPLR